jgi:hypothetical protein
VPVWLSWLGACGDWASANELATTVAAISINGAGFIVMSFLGQFTDQLRTRSMEIELALLDVAVRPLAAYDTA